MTVRGRNDGLPRRAAERVLRNMSWRRRDATALVPVSGLDDRLEAAYLGVLAERFDALETPS